jgi:hypothetical protein
MARIFFLKSFCNDKTLAPLIQNLYDVEPFSFEKLADRMNVEDSWSEQSLGTLNVIGSRKVVQPNKGKFKSTNKSPFRNVVPTRNVMVTTGGSSKSKIEDAEFNKIIDARIEMLRKLQTQKLNCINEIDTGDEGDAIQEIDSDNPDNSGFFLGEDFNFHLGPINHNDVCLILNTGATRSTLSNI